MKDPQTWVKARKSDSNGGSCVEQRRHEGIVQVRDTKQEGMGPVLALTRAEFATWIGAAKRGEFDHLR